MGDISEYSSEEDDWIGSADEEEPAPAPCEPHHKAHKIHWKARDLEPTIHPFTGRPGIKLALDQTSTELDVFKCMFTQDILERIMYETNLFARQTEKMEAQGQKKRPWTPVTLDELQVCFAFLILMGPLQKPSYKDYWSTDELWETSLFSRTMPRDRFLDIMSCLHFNDNTRYDADEGDRLFKLRPLVDALLRNFKAAYVPTRHISTDESLANYYGIILFKQFCPLKAAKYGFKIFKTCQSDGAAGGYVYTFKVYTADEAVPGNVPVGSQIVMELNQDLLHQGYCLYLDNWYSSPDLFIDLYRAGTNVCGTVRMYRRNMPVDFKKHFAKREMARGDIQFRSTKKGLLAMVWRDKRDVRLLSTFHSAKMVDTGKKDRRTGAPIVKPELVIDYNKGMCGVDRSDQLTVAYTTSRKCKKWYRKLFLHFFDMALSNAWLLFRELGNGKVKQIKFRRELVRQILSSVTLPPYRLWRRPVVHVNTSHYLDPLPTIGNGKVGRRACKICMRQNRRKTTTLRCMPCNVAVCATPCFNRHCGRRGSYQ